METTHTPNSQNLHKYNDLEMTTPSWIGEMDLQSNDKYTTRRKAQIYLGQKRRYLEDSAERERETTQRARKPTVENGKGNKSKCLTVVSGI